MGGGYIYRPSIDDIFCLVVPWCLSTLVVDGGYRRDALIKSNICVLVSVAIAFVIIVKEIGETVSLGGLGKLF